MTLAEFFKDQLELLAEENQELISCIEEQYDDVPKECFKIMCSILNSQHIINCRLQRQIPESEEFDELPFHSWSLMNRENFNQSKNILDEVQENSESEVIRWLQQMIKESVYKRGQINQVLEKKNLKFSSMNFVRMGLS